VTSSATTIVIVNWNTRDLVLKCLAALQAHAPGTPVWVIDNASTDGSAEAIARDFPSVRLSINPSNVGFARANNLALRELETPFVWLLNPDTEIRPGALASLEATLRAYPQAAVVGSALFNPDGTPQACSFAFPTPLGTWAEWLYLPGPLARARDYLFQLAPRRQDGSTDWVLGASMLVRGTAIDAVGLLDEGYFVYSEELDWCWRFRVAGWDVRLSLASEVVHHGGASTKQVAEPMLIELFRTRARYFKRQLPLKSHWFLTPLMWSGAAWNSAYVLARGLPGVRVRTQWAIAQAVAEKDRAE
jgi:N-acetylglucosaminyl-diphospho-decaprenol L-rhamnosyltransferase